MDATDAVLRWIDKEELAALALAMGNIDSPTGEEQAMGDFVNEWYQRQGFKTRLISAVRGRPNVIGMLRGTGGGCSLLFNAHMDTAVSAKNLWSRRDCNAPVFHSAWRDGDRLYGHGVVNDKGPMACFMMAASAIKRAGIELQGDLLLTSVSGEIGWEPVDEFESAACLGQSIGTRFVARHGAIADYVIVAESTGSTFSWVEAGKLFVKLTVYGGPRIYTPFLKPTYAPETEPNAIVKMHRVFGALQAWSRKYQSEHVYTCPGGTVIPRTAFGAIRGGDPFFLDGSAELCALYLDIRTLPGQDFLAIKAELEQILRSLGIDGEVEIIVSEPGYEAKNIEALAEAVSRAHRVVFGDELTAASGPYSSMWRDTNAYNEIGIPALTYGPLTRFGPSSEGGEMDFSMSVDDLHKAAQVYAKVALDICNRERLADVKCNGQRAVDRRV
jgi:acetylornithine deacetylase/succinyl-diaminopimelate desuccinylase-like protein